MSVPKLRFKDGSPIWQVDTLLNVSESGFTNGVFNDPSKKGRGYKLINVLDMYIESTIDENRLALVELSDIEFKKNKVEHREIFFTRSSLVKEGIACSNVYDGNSEDVTFDGHLIRMRPKENVLNHIFANYLLKTREVRKQLVARGKTATMTTIGQADIAAVLIMFPEIPEQTKIADFLTAVDEKIAQLARKLDLLTQYKKGVMQQIFSQALRFKADDGQEFPEWRTAPLSKLVKVYDGTHMTPDYKESGVPFFSVEHLTSNNFTNTKFIAEDIFERENLRVCLKKGDILMTRIGDIGTSRYIDWDVRASFYVSLALLKQSEKINSVYLSHYINGSFFQRELHQRTIHVAFPKKINLGEIGACLVTYPHLAEQTKIADFLTAIDDKITGAQAQLAAAKQYKQGLLQQLFV